MLTIDSLLQQLRTSAPTWRKTLRHQFLGLGGAIGRAKQLTRSRHQTRCRGSRAAVFAGAAQLMLNKLRPKLVIMEFFVERLRACDALLSRRLRRAELHAGRISQAQYAILRWQQHTPLPGPQQHERQVGTVPEQSRTTPGDDLVFYQGHHPP